MFVYSEDSGIAVGRNEVGQGVRGISQTLA
jgi:hypothetical protein